MDTFMDKLAQRLNAQEMIDANTAADVEELSRLRGRIKEYDECLEQMRAVNQELRAVHEQMGRLVEEVISPQMQRLVDSNLAMIESTRTAAADMDALLQESRAQLQTVRDMGSVQLQRASEEGSTQMQKMAEESNAQVKKLVQEHTLQFQKCADEADGQMKKAAVEHGARLQKMTEEGTAQLTRIAVEATVQMQELLAESTSHLDKISEESVKLLRECGESGQREAELKQMVQEKLEGIHEYVHKECVKVYRNVQAVILEENGKQEQRLRESAAAAKDKISKVWWLSAAAFLFSAAGVAIQVLAMLELL